MLKVTWFNSIFMHKAKQIGGNKYLMYQKEVVKWVLGLVGKVDFENDLEFVHELFWVLSAITDDPNATNMIMKHKSMA